MYIKTFLYIMICKQDEKKKNSSVYKARPLFEMTKELLRINKNIFVTFTAFILVS